MRAQNKMKVFLAFGFLVYSIIACSYQKPVWESPSGYDLSAPQKHIMPERLFEISGIAFDKSDSLYGIADEMGTVYHIELEHKNASPVIFAKSGDYEDLTFYHNQLFILRSDGNLFRFTINSDAEPPSDQVMEYKGLLPKGEYEGLYANEQNQLYVLCKNCKKTDDQVMRVYVFQIHDNELVEDNAITVDLSKFRAQLKNSKTFRPSGFTQNTSTGDWYVISSVNRVLLVADAAWNIKNVYPLNLAVFGQPEGIAFDAANNLYIANEGDEFRNGNVLKFTFSHN